MEPVNGSTVVQLGYSASFQRGALRSRSLFCLLENSNTGIDQQGQIERRETWHSIMSNNYVFFLVEYFNLGKNN